jgi:hypothetical protein
VAVQRIGTGSGAPGCRFVESDAAATERNHAGSFEEEATTIRSGTEQSLKDKGARRLAIL